MPYGYQEPEKIKKAKGKFHYPDEELLKQVGNRAYKLKDYQKKSVEEIERRLKSGQESTFLSSKSLLIGFSSP